ncbi:MAG: DUF5989 family protein [Candidatus Binatus sp.]|uniref:DUF5989 family protein n=1 Tax=Candidatus Binatus sp. TaxID=2811406 RepID=UPI0027191B0B|nr:DUF5989 family protein [Candidatus Binatus sp.]MDO8431277.1 DUF5989 family protein [Candidatus Binatus sp.]
MFELVGDVWGFTRAQQKYWMIPLIAALLAVGGLVVVAQSSAIAPFIYTLF